MDLVAIGTVADCVSLSDENRILVKKGLEILNNTKRIGIKELIKAAQIDKKKLDAWNIGFQIAPRINAAGRMDHANTAFELLITKNKEEAIALARRLNNKNVDRQETTKEIVEYVDKNINKKDKIIVTVCPKDLEGEAWNEGVIGLVAGRICQKYYRPTLIITKSPEGYKGSGRSIEEFNVMEAIEESREFLDKFGGHAMACGFSLSEKNLGKFKKKIKEITEKKLKNIKLEQKIIIEKEINILDVNNDLIKDIERFAPFGQENNQPIFASRNVQIRDIMTMGADGKHIKFRLNGFWALAFNGAEEWKDLKIGDKIDIAYYVEINEFNGKSEVQLKIVDIKI
ncbi:MAG: DHHA1 domain-containing protein [Candidatus Falkowbacteria bacterium]